MVQWLGLGAFIAMDPISIPDLGTKSIESCVAQQKQTKKIGTSLVAQSVKNLLAMQETWV